MDIAEEHDEEGPPMRRPESAPEPSQKHPLAARAACPLERGRGPGGRCHPLKQRTPERRGEPTGPSLLERLQRQRRRQGERTATAEREARRNPSQTPSHLCQEPTQEGQIPIDACPWKKPQLPHTCLCPTDTEGPGPYKTSPPSAYTLHTTQRRRPSQNRDAMSKIKVSIDCGASKIREHSVLEDAGDRLDRDDVEVPCS